MLHFSAQRTTDHCGQGQGSCLQCASPAFSCPAACKQTRDSSACVRLTSRTWPRPRQDLTYQLRLTVKNRNFQDG